MSITWENIRDMPSGEFNSISQETIEFYLSQATLRLNISYFGGLYDSALLYLTCHLLAQDLSGSNTGFGGITRFKAGELEQDFGGSQNSTIPATYSATSYGRRYYEIVRLCSVTPIVV